MEISRRSVAVRPAENLNDCLLIIIFVFVQKTFVTWHIGRLRGAHAIDYSTLYSGLPPMWEELVGLKKGQELRPNLFFFGFLPLSENVKRERREQQGGEAESSRH